MWVPQWLAQGLAVAVIATLAVRLVPSTSPRVRHLFWWVALAGVLGLPWVPALLASPVTAVALDPARRGFAVEVPAPPAWLWAGCITLWGGTALAGFLSLLADLRALRTFKRSARPLPWSEVRTAEPLHLPATAVRGAALAVSDELLGACAVGFFAPRVIVSSRLVSSLEPPALESIVRHELAHLERFDDWLRLLQRLVLALAGLHPAVRWISRQIDIEREAACDQLVVERTGSPLTYARALTAAAELTNGMHHGVPALAPGASVSGAGLHARVVRLLRAQAAPSSRRVRATAGASLATLALAVTGVAGLPPLVVIASLEPSLRALASLPAGRVFVPALPALRARGVPASAQADEPVTVQIQETSINQAEPQPLPRVDADAVAPNDDGLIVPAETLEVPARREVRIEPTAPDGSPFAVTDTIGARASRVGSATGSTAARAGSALGRFFSKGGQAVADRF